MTRRSPTTSVRAGVSRRGFAAGAGAAGLLAGTAPFNILRAQSGPLKVGVLLPRSGAQAGIGQDCQRGVELAPAIFKDLGLPELTIMNGLRRKLRGRANEPPKKSRWRVSNDARP